MFSNIKDRFDNIPHSQILLLILCIVFTLITLIIITLLLNRPKAKIPIAPPSPTAPPLANPESYEQNKVSLLQKTDIGRTTNEEIERALSTKSKSSLPDGKTSYTFPSFLKSRDNMIITKNNAAIFERTLIPEASKDPGFIRISYFKKKYGEPQQIIRGSHFYGNLVNTYIYGNDGFTLIGNAFTDEVFEVHTFIPTTVDDYIQEFGEDINKNAPDGEY